MAEAKCLRVLAGAALAALAVHAADRLPPVLRNSEPADSRVVLLPGPAPAKPFVEPPPAPRASAAQPDLAPPELPDPGRPVLPAVPKPLYPADLEKDSGIFCQTQIGLWRLADAVALLGVPAADRPAYDDRHAVNGHIFAFADPTNRYQQLELDFDGDTATLRTVFAYPRKMTWQDCHRMWGGNVSAADAPQGRKFYSYLNRRLDVLVDATGNVISIGLY